MIRRSLIPIVADTLDVPKSHRCELSHRRLTPSLVTPAGGRETGLDKEVRTWRTKVSCSAADAGPVSRSR
jgi:hypothetical protein